MIAMAVYLNPLLEIVDKKTVTLTGGCFFMEHFNMKYSPYQL